MSKQSKLTKSYSGIFGNQFRIRNKGANTIVTIVPKKPKIAPTPKQVAVRERLKIASRYAQTARSQPALFAEYAARANKKRSAFHQAMYDFLHPPFINKIDASGYHGNPGDKVKVTAGDDFKLESVSLKLSGPDGCIIEEGPCALNNQTMSYEYNATVRVSNLTGVTICASARDLPGNLTQHSILL